MTVLRLKNILYVNVMLCYADMIITSYISVLSFKVILQIKYIQGNVERIKGIFVVLDVTKVKCGPGILSMRKRVEVKKN